MLLLIGFALFLQPGCFCVGPGYTLLLPNTIQPEGEHFRGIVNSAVSWIEFLWIARILKLNVCGYSKFT